MNANVYSSLEIYNNRYITCNAIGVVYNEAMNAARLHWLARHLREVAADATADAGDGRISASALAIIEDVANHPATSVGEVAGRTRLAQSLVSRTVAAMREAGVFVTTPDHADRRRLLISIDPATRLQLFRDRGARPIDRELARALPECPPTTIARALALLEELSAIFDAQPDGTAARENTP